MKVIIDRFEKDFAVVELPNQKMANMPIELLPEKAREGDVIEIRIDMEETKERKKIINKLMSEVFE